MSLQDLGGAAKRALITLASPSGLTEPSSELLEILPLAIYACDADGRILWFNRRAAELWGRTPRIGDESEKFSGSHKLYFSGQLISREQTPMAEALRTGL